MVGGEISGNGAYNGDGGGAGIALHGEPLGDGYYPGPLVNSLRVRGTKFGVGRGDAIWFGGGPTSTLDLGATNDAGGNVFSEVAAGYSAVHLTAPIRGLASGNTWVPSAQGADSSGLYSVATSFAPGAQGPNATVVGTGASLVVSE